MGTVTASLVGRTPSGATYRLRDAVITVTGPGTTVVWNIEDDPDRTSLSADVPVGSYSASLASGWRLERTDGSSPTTVTADLVSANPVEFDVVPDERTSVPLQFQIGAEILGMAQGYDITVDVDVVPVREIFIADPVASRILVFPATADGDVAPIRFIRGPDTTLLGTFCLDVVGDELVVCDQQFRNIYLFPVSASGNVAPTRRFHVGGNGPFKALVSNGELYVSVLEGSLDVFAFPPNSGDPVIRSLATSDENQGSPFAIDGGELYVGSALGGRVFPIPPAGSSTFPPLTRTFSDRTSWNDIDVRGDEIFVAREGGIDVYPRVGGDGSPLRTITSPLADLFPLAIRVVGNTIYVANGENIRVYRADASGDTLPLRTIGGPTTGQMLARGIAVR